MQSLIVSVSASIVLTSSWFACTPAFGQTPSHGSPSNPVVTHADVPDVDAKHVLLGQSLSRAQNSQFFQFFNFSKSWERPDPAHPGEKMVWFGTAGAFKGSVNLDISMKDGDDRIIRTALMLRRDFVDSPKTSKFARDVVKSFLELSAGYSSAEISKLHSDIWIGCDPNYTDYVSSPSGEYQMKSCEQKEAPSGGYLTYLGKQEKYKVTYPGGSIELQNSTKILGVPLLFVEMDSESSP